MTALLDKSIAISVAPTWEPVKLSEFKDYVSEFSNDRDDELSGILSSARADFEKDTRTTVPATTYVWKQDRWPVQPGIAPLQGFIELRRPPLSSVTSITYLDTDGNEQTWASSNYEVDTARIPGAVFLAFNKTWPTAREIQNSITITYVCGNASAAVVPAEIKLAIKELGRSYVEGCEPSDHYTRAVHRHRWGSYR